MARSCVERSVERSVARQSTSLGLGEKGSWLAASCAYVQAVLQLVDQAAQPAITCLRNATELVRREAVTCCATHDLSGHRLVSPCPWRVVEEGAFRYASSLREVFKVHVPHGTSLSTKV